MVGIDITPPERNRKRRFQARQGDGRGPPNRAEEVEFPGQHEPTENPARPLKRAVGWEWTDPGVWGTDLTPGAARVPRYCEAIC